MLNDFHRINGILIGHGADLHFAEDALGGGLIDLTGLGHFRRALHRRSFFHSGFLRSRLLHNRGFHKAGLHQSLGHGCLDGVGGHGRAGHAVHVHALGLKDLRGQFFCRHTAELRRLAVLYNLDGIDAVRIGNRLQLDLAENALGRGRIGLRTRRDFRLIGPRVGIARHNVQQQDKHQEHAGGNADDIQFLVFHRLSSKERFFRPL